MKTNDDSEYEQESMPKNNKLFTINTNYNSSEINKLMKSSTNIFTHLSPLLTETLTTSIGIANNKLCAKMASDFTKPNKIHTLYNYEIKEKMWPLDVGELFMVGKKTAEKLKIMNINTIGKLANTEPIRLYPMFKNQAKFLVDIANGIDNSAVDSSSYEAKGISNEITLEKDYSNYKELEPFLLALCDKVSLRLRKLNKSASVIAVILKDNTFKRRTHQKKLDYPTNTTDEIFEVAKIILKEMQNDDEIRLIGLRLDDLSVCNIRQISLFNNSLNDDSKLDKTIDKLKEKYGTNILFKAGSVKLKNKKE